MARNFVGFLAKNKLVWVSGKTKNIPGANWLIYDPAQDIPNVASFLAFLGSGSSTCWRFAFFFFCRFFRLWLPTGEYKYVQFIYSPIRFSAPQHGCHYVILVDWYL